ncbi:hypothetical protein [Longimicrobium sp.]|uniref:hypothetical protein n=1 Tax=Longimicrobium sp. TaxID=2029185 RepID=UPI002C028703|nr:hypothetical protein [Longimicrobium sp.]HSU15930.1 hypothetical protein [Longimicrobium sp.]
MKKLALDLAALTVESFETFVPEDRRGTVRANSGCVTYSCPPGTCGAQPLSDIEKNGDYAGTFAPNCTPACCV